MDLKLQGKSALVTGGSRAWAPRSRPSSATRERASLFLLGTRPRLRLQPRACALRPSERLPSRPTPPASERRVRCERGGRAAGGVDILVNGAAKAAGGPPTSFLDLDDDDLRSEMETKVLGYLRCVRAVAPQMIERGWGRIINISGLAARRTGSVFGSVRNVSVAAMSKNLADELGPKGVNVTVVHPWVTETEGVKGMIRAGAAAVGSPRRSSRRSRRRRQHWPDRPALRGRPRGHVPCLATQCRHQRRWGLGRWRPGRADLLLTRASAEPSPARVGPMQTVVNALPRQRSRDGSGGRCMAERARPRPADSGGGRPPGATTSRTAALVLHADRSWRALLPPAASTGSSATR